MTSSLDLFVEGDSGIHRMDPRLKLMGFGLLIAATALVTSLYAALTAWALSVCWVIYARIPLGFVAKRIRVAVFFLSAFFLVLPFSHPLGMEKGLLQALVILLKGTAMMLAVFPMFGTSRFDLSIKALEKLKVSSTFVTLIFFTTRYISAYSDQLKTIQMNLRSRGFKVKADWLSLKITGHLIGSLLVRSFEQTEQIYRAMVSRGYSEHFVTIHEFAPLRRADKYKFGALFFAALGLMLLDRIAQGGLAWIR